MGGTEKEVLENKDLRNIFLPVLRADYKLVEEYVYKPKNAVYDFNISVLFGVNDNDLEKDILEWQKQTSAICKFYKFKGGHFYLNDNIERITSIINKELLGK